MNNSSTVALWITDIEIHGWRDQYIDLLSADEFMRMRTYRRRDDADRFLVGKTLLRHALTKMSAPEQNVWTFDTPKGRKPQIADPTKYREKIDFNISHSGALVAVALANHPIRVGVDVEQIGLRTPTEIYEAVFTQREQRWLHCNDERMNQHRFWKLWTMKESLLKAIGLGIVNGLQNVEIDVSEGGKMRLLKSPENLKGSTSWITSIINRHQVALCVQNPENTGFHLNAYSCSGEHFIDCKVMPM